jgi:hypothetical protein
VVKKRRFSPFEELTFLLLDCIIYAEIYGGKPPVERKVNWHDLQY